MKVYLAEVMVDFENPSAVGVFSTVEAAQQACGESPESWRHDENSTAWYRPEVWTDPMRVPDGYSTLGWTVRRLFIAPSAHIAEHELDLANPVDGTRENASEARPLTAEDEIVWKAHMGELRRTGRVFSTSDTFLNSSS